MSRKSWQLRRRTFLRGCGVSLGLPLLDCMASGDADQTRPKRFCGVYFPYGIVLRKEDSPVAKWNWFPHQVGSDYRLGASHQALEPFRDDCTILSGLSHPNGRKMNGHDTADVWLTGAELKGGQLKNSVSFDQLIAHQNADQTRFGSLVMSTDGGTGEPTRSSTLSFTATGQPIPSVNRPRWIFDRLFGVDPESAETQTRRLDESTRMLDLILDHSRSLRRQLGQHDQRKLDEYLESVHQIEDRVASSKRWLHVPKPQVNADGLHLDADDSTPRELIRTMYDLIYLAFRTDSTRVATYQISNMNGATSLASKFPQLLGYGPNIHALAHGARKGDKGAEELGRWDQFLTEQLAYFIGRLRSTAEGDGSLLDHTVLLYGSSNSQTHVNTNYPLILAGGNRLGLRHGQHVAYDSDVPLTNLFATLLPRLGSPHQSFVDSTGELPQILT